MTNTPSPTDEDRELDRILRAWENGEMDAAGTIEDLVKVADRLLSDKAKLEEAALAGTLSMSNGQVIADFDTREDAELFYERLALVLLNRSTDRAT